MRIFIILVEIDETQIHRINVDKGEYLIPERVRGNLGEQSKQILFHILQEKPDKIIVEKFGFGLGLYQMLIHTMNTFGLSVDEDGKVIY